jgi:hypothetical protein
MDKFKFGDKVRKIGGRDVFVVLGWEPREYAGNGGFQIAALNWKTSAKPSELEPA